MTHALPSVGLSRRRDDHAHLAVLGAREGRPAAGLLPAAGVGGRGGRLEETLSLLEAGLPGGIVSFQNPLIFGIIVVILYQTPKHLV
jgi:hypothetical protein